MSSEYEAEIGMILPACSLVVVCNVKSLASGVTCINIRSISHQILTLKTLDDLSLCILQHKISQIMYYILIYFQKNKTSDCCLRH